MIISISPNQQFVIEDKEIKEYYNKNLHTHGYWIASEDSLMASCSHCSMTFPGWRIWPANYCPNCGTKMDGESNV